MNKKGIKQVSVPVEVFLGKTRIDLEKIPQIGEGTIIELDAFAGEPVEVRLAGKHVAWGEVVVIDENFGVRVTQIVEKPVVAREGGSESV